MGSDRVLDALSTLATTVRDAGGSVVLVRTAGSPGANGRPARGPEAGEEGWDLLLKPEPADVVVDAPGLNAFFGSGLDSALRARGLDRLAVGGLGLETLVYSTLTGANDRGYECVLLTDASAPHEPPVAERAISSVTMSGGIFGATGSASALSTLLSSS